MTPGKDVVTVRVNVLLLPFVGSNSFTMISNAATLLANLVGILGVLGGFASAFALVEKNRCKFQPPLCARSVTTSCAPLPFLPGERVSVGKWRCSFHLRQPLSPRALYSHSPLFLCFNRVCEAEQVPAPQVQDKAH